MDEELVKEEPKRQKGLVVLVGGASYSNCGGVDDLADSGSAGYLDGMGI